MSVIFKRTKILATLGPKTSTPEMISDLAKAGVNGFRLINFSHGDYSERDDQIHLAGGYRCRMWTPQRLSGLQKLVVLHIKA